jgi:hypothetical protein
MNRVKNLVNKVPAMVAGLIAISGAAMAQSITAASADSTWGSAFADIYGWVAGGLGDLIALSAFMVGVCAAVAMSQGKALALGGGIIVALAIKVGPTIYLTIAGATIHGLAPSALALLS